MRYAAIREDDIVNGEGVCVSFWVQGCPHRCKGCHNPELWEFDGGINEPINEVRDKIIAAMEKNGVERNFSILGGEPLCSANIAITISIATFVRNKYPNCKIYLWTGYDLDLNADHFIPEFIKNTIDVVIDGPYIEDQRDITLPLRGSRNQRVLRRGIDF